MIVPALGPKFIDGGVFGFRYGSFPRIRSSRPGFSPVPRSTIIGEIERRAKLELALTGAHYGTLIRTLRPRQFLPCQG